MSHGSIAGFRFIRRRALLSTSLLRSYNFTDPEAVKDMRYEGEQAANAPIPAEVREALRVALEKSDVPAQLPKVESPHSPKK